MKNMLKNKGFTLIELLVVIAIIGILSSVVLASLNSARTKSRDARRLSDVGQVKLALELFFDDNGNYPISASAANISTALLGLVSGNHIGALPADPNNTTNPYFYISDSGGSIYCVGAVLEGTSNTLDTCTSPVLSATYTYQIAP